MATLPAIDANDEPKSLAAFRFYCCTLGSLGQLPVSFLHVVLSSNLLFLAAFRLFCCTLGFWTSCRRVSTGGVQPHPDAMRCHSPSPTVLPTICLQEAPSPTLPLYAEEWVEELLGRCFAIITNLDSPEHRGEPSCASLVCITCTVAHALLPDTICALHCARQGLAATAATSHPTTYSIQPCRGARRAGAEVGGGRLLPAGQQLHVQVGGQSLGSKFEFAKC